MKILQMTVVGEMIDFSLFEDKSKNIISNKKIKVAKKNANPFFILKSLEDFCIENKVIINGLFLTQTSFYYAVKNENFMYSVRDKEVVS